MFRRLLWASLALGPFVIVLHHTTDIGEEAEFALASLALIPLAWLIGEATEHVSDHTGAASAASSTRRSGMRPS